MSDFDQYSRVNKFEKRRKNTKAISVLLVVSGLLVILLIGIWIFGGNDDEQAANNANNNNDNMDVTNEENNDESVSSDVEQDTDISSDQADDEDAGTVNNNDETIEEEDKNAEYRHELDDDIVIDTINEGWAPIGTEQEGPHTTRYEEGSLDRIEMEQAIRLATNLTEDNLITWWLQHGGDQKVIATVSNRQETEIYRVYLSWIENEGWQPTLVEVLSENDQKWRFE